MKTLTRINENSILRNIEGMRNQNCDYVSKEEKVLVISLHAHVPDGKAAISQHCCIREGVTM